MKKTAIIMFLLLGVVGIVAIQAACHELGVAHAQSGSGSAATVVAPTDNVLDNPADSISTIAKLWDSGAITSACIVLAFFVLIVLRSRVPWFSEGWRAVWIAALIGGLGFLVDLINTGATPNVSMIMIAVSTTLATALRMPPKAPA
jgi:hypothetical protein